MYYKLPRLNNNYYCKHVQMLQVTQSMDWTGEHFSFGLVFNSCVRFIFELTAKFTQRKN